MVSYVYKRCGRILAGKPFLLWGLSLLGSLLTFLAWIFGCLPIIAFPIALTLEAGMAMIYLDGYRGKQVNSDQLFAGFKNFWHVAGGMAWRTLWKMIWGMVFFFSVFFIIGAAGAIGALSFVAVLRNSIPGASDIMDSSSAMSGGASVGLFLMCIVFGILAIVGCVLYVIKIYSYRFAPYILMEKPEVSATEALRQSVQMTKGRKGTLFLADILLYLGLFLVWLILGLFAAIPVIGAVFGVIIALLQTVVGVVLPLFFGLVRAGLYIEISQGTQVPRYQYHPVSPTVPRSEPSRPEPPVQHMEEEDMTEVFRQESAPSQNGTGMGAAPAFCKKCGASLKAGQKFCTKCGTPVK